jgi:hypothetical protein
VSKTFFMNDLRSQVTFSVHRLASLWRSLRDVCGDEIKDGLLVRLQIGDISRGVGGLDRLEIAAVAVVDGRLVETGRSVNIALSSMPQCVLAFARLECMLTMPMRCFAVALLHHDAPQADALDLPAVRIGLRGIVLELVCFAAAVPRAVRVGVTQLRTGTHIDTSATDEDVTADNSGRTLLQ